MRVVLDTNVVVSALLSPGGTPAQVFEQWRLQAFELLVSEPLLAEYQQALQYERVAARHGLSPMEIAEVIAGVRQFALHVESRETIAVVTEDPADNRVLECAIAAAAGYIVSGDTHLLKVREYHGIPILSPAAFVALLHNDPSRKITKQLT